MKIIQVYFKDMKYLNIDVIKDLINKYKKKKL